MLVCAKKSECSVHLFCRVFLGNWCKFVNLGRLLAWKHLAGDLSLSSGRLELLSGGVINESLLWLVSDLGPENQLGLVGVQSLHIELKLLLTSVGSPVINTDSDSSGEAGAQFGSTELL